MNISIIVPFRNAERTLERCVHSLQAQRYPHGAIEIVLVDNGSTDRSPEIAAEFHGIVVFRENHASIYAARNLGARKATGEILMFTQANCLAEPDWVKRHMTALGNPNVSVSIGRLAPIKSTWLLSIFDAYENTRDDWNFGADNWKQYFGRPTNLAIRRKRFEGHGPFEEVLRGGDSLFVQKVAREISCNEVCYCSNAVVKHLALDGIGSYLKYQFHNSRIMCSLHSSHSAPIRVRDRVRLFCKTARKEQYGPIRSTVLLILLALGVLVWKTGQWSAALRPATYTEI